MSVVNEIGKLFIISPSLVRADDQNDSRLIGRSSMIIQSCYHDFDDDFAVLLVNGMKHNLMLVLV